MFLNKVNVEFQLRFATRIRMCGVGAGGETLGVDGACAQSWSPGGSRYVEAQWSSFPGGELEIEWDGFVDDRPCLDDRSAG